jgi:hypothetical protein
MERKRVPGYITTQVTNNFGLDVSVQRQVLPKQDMYSSGDPVPEGQEPDNANLAGDVRYREVIPPGEIGSVAGGDLDILTPPQYVDTVADYEKAQNDPAMHSAVHSLREGAKTELPFQCYGTFQPRSAPMPRAAQDQVYLEGYGQNAADPRMTDESATTGLQATDKPDRAPLYGDNRDGVLHNNFASAQAGIAKKEGIPSANAGAILASASRNASPAAKKANPNLKKVK